jgi:hypothetical protein
MVVMFGQQTIRNRQARPRHLLSGQADHQRGGGKDWARRVGKKTKTKTKVKTKVKTKMRKMRQTKKIDLAISSRFFPVKPIVESLNSFWLCLNATQNMVSYGKRPQKPVLRYVMRCGDSETDFICRAAYRRVRRWRHHPAITRQSQVPRVKFRVSHHLTHERLDYLPSR